MMLVSSTSHQCVVDIFNIQPESHHSGHQNTVMALMILMLSLMLFILIDVQIIAELANGIESGEIGDIY